MKHYLRVCAEINLDAVAYNMSSIKENLAEGTRIIAVVKMDGYGHGAIPIAQMIEAYDYVWGFGVATIDEALLLRKSGIQKPILTLGGIFPDAYEELVKHDIRATVFKLATARQLSEEAVRQNKTVYMHIKVDTGMSRVGFRDDEESADIIKEISALPNVELEGLFTHFAKADEKDKTFTHNQINRYLAFKKLLKERDIQVSMYHCSNSAGVFDVSTANMDAVRVGAAMYGMYPSEDVDKFAVPIVPVMTLKSHIIYIKDLRAGESVSYGGTFTAEKPMRVATIPIGYADGYPRSLSNKGWVLIRGHQARILGKVCMDQFMVDVTNIPGAREGDMVTLIGSDGGCEITLEDMGNRSGRFNYELVCDISKRIPRRFWKDGQIVATQDYFSNNGIEQK